MRRAEILRLLRITTLESRGFGPWTNNFRDLPGAARHVLELSISSVGR